MNKRRVIMGIRNGRDFDLLTPGQLLLKPLPPDNRHLSRGDTFVKQIGGAELNVVVGVALLGPHTGVISKLLVHDTGSFIKGKIRSFGVSDDFFIYDQSSLTHMGIYHYKNGAYPRRPKVTYDHDNSSFLSLNINEIPEEVYMASKCFHTTGITLALNEKIRETTIRTIKRFKAAGALVSFDVNFRGNLQTGDGTREYILHTLPYAGIFFCPEGTARLTFLKTGTVKETMRSFSQEFPISIVASMQRIVHSPKCHIFGSVIYDAARDEYYGEEPYRDIEVVDQVGSGDAYISDILYGLLSSGGDCSKVIAYGNTTVAMKSTVPRNLPSSNLGEIETIIRTYNQTGPQSEMARREIVTKLQKL